MLKRVPANDCLFTFPIQNNVPQVISATVKNGASDGKKAFIAIFNFYDAKGGLIQGPHQRLSFSKLGAYKYVDGGMAAAPHLFSTLIPAVPTAVKVDLIITSWECPDKPQFAQAPTLNANASVSSAKQPANKVEAFKTAAFAEEFHTRITRPLIHTELEDALITLTDTPQWLEFDGNDTHDFSINVHLRSDNLGAKSEATLRVRYLDAQGSDMPYNGPDLTHAKDIGYYKHIPSCPSADTALLRLFPPPGCEKILLGFQSWKTKNKVVIRNGIQFAAMQYGVSVIIPCYKGKDYILRCLNSLAEQTLPREKFEVLVIINGPDDGTEKLVKDFKHKNKDFDISVTRDPEANVGKARNYGLLLARFQYTTFVDADDEISPRYLTNLLLDADIDKIVFSSIADVYADGNIDLKNQINQQIHQNQKGTLVAWDKISTAITMNACKLVPTYYLKQLSYETNLKSSEDVCFFCLLLIRFPLKFQVASKLEDTVYLRHLIDQSVSRQSMSYDFNVTQRLTIARILDEQLKQYPQSVNKDLVKAKIRSQMLIIGQYCEKHPDQYDKVIRAARGMHLSYFTVDIINGRAARSLVVAYCFPPYVDTSAIVMGKRCAMWGEPFDAIYNKLEGLREKDMMLNDLVKPLMGYSHETQAPNLFTHWPAMQKFCDDALEQIAKFEYRKGRKYEKIFTRTMWPASHFVGAAYKIKNPDVKWTAEFSDPLLYDIKSKERRTALSMEWLQDKKIIDAIKDQGIEPPSDDNLYLWAEIAPYCLADTILFTNKNQMTYMMGYCPFPDLRARIKKKTVIEAQPTPPAEFYNRVSTKYYLDPERVNIGFFGSMYETRGLGEFFDAIATLPASDRKKIRLHIFTQQIKQMLTQVRKLGISDSVILNNYVGFFEHLNLLTKLDVLLINDYATDGIKPINPYLPAKLSDCMGAGTDIWGIIEKGSILSQYKKLAYTSKLGSTSDYIKALTKIARSKKLRAA